MLEDLCVEEFIISCGVACGEFRYSAYRRDYSLAMQDTATAVLVVV